MNKKLLVAALSAVVFSGCASIVSKSEYAVAINSNPDAARFSITNRAGQKIHSGVTPASINLKSSSGYFKGETYTIELEKEGYSPKTYTLTSSVNGWYFGNILFGGLIGMLIVDPATGAMYKLPERVDVPFDQKLAFTNPGNLTIATIDSLSQEQVARLQRIQ